MSTNPDFLRLGLFFFLAIAVAGCSGTRGESPAVQAVPVEQLDAKPVSRKNAAIRAATADELMGKTPQALRALMGPPSLLRKDHGAEVWQYAGDACVLLAYLYPNAKGVPQVSYLDARRKTSGAMPVPDCLALLSGAAPTS
jgi:hypothetical protein